jgi:glycosyltransferase involved in cell wall biosynthesis
MSIPVIINNRDLLTWPKAMVERISKYDNIGDIIIIDNGSTYEPLLEWYKTNPCQIIYQTNLGIAAPWICQAVSNLKSEYYVVTDADMGLENTPDDTLLYLKDKLQSLKDLGKIGLGLDWQKVENKSPYYGRLNLYEKDRWNTSKIKNEVYIDVQIDTTFALYSNQWYFIGGGSTTFPYVARHYPWEMSIEEARQNIEFKYYIDNATSASSYKLIVNL